MQSYSVEIPEAVLYDTRMTEESSRRFVKRAAALMFYTKKGVSLGYCAQIAGMSKADFLRFLADNQIPVIDPTHDELMKDIENA